MKFHIHITVNPNGADYAYYCEKHGMEPLVISNVIWDGDSYSYVEYIPTLKMDCRRAADAAYHAGMVAGRLESVGMEILRAKLETEPLPDFRHAKYYETHLKYPANMLEAIRESRLPVSINVRNTEAIIVTLRDLTTKGLSMLLSDMTTQHGLTPLHPPKIEMCIYDTNPALDEKWISQ